MAPKPANIPMATSDVEEDGSTVVSFSINTWMPDSTVLTADLHGLVEVQANIAVHRVLMRCQEATGGHVVMHPDCHHMPALVSTEGHPVLLYEFVESLDGSVTYEEIEEALSLTYEQIHSAMSFLRRVAMINPGGFDPDEVEDAEDAQDPALLQALRRGVEYDGDLRVLDTE